MPEMSPAQGRTKLTRCAYHCVARRHFTCQFVYCQRSASPPACSSLSYALFCRGTASIDQLSFYAILSVLHFYTNASHISLPLPFRLRHYHRQTAPTISLSISPNKPPRFRFTDSAESVLQISYQLFRYLIRLTYLLFVFYRLFAIRHQRYNRASNQTCHPHAHAELPPDHKTGLLLVKHALQSKRIEQIPCLTTY